MKAEIGEDEGRQLMGAAFEVHDHRSCGRVEGL